MRTLSKMDDEFEWMDTDSVDDINETDEWGRTRLHFSLCRGRCFLGIFDRLVVREDVDVNIADCSGERAIHACILDTDRCLKLIRRPDTDINARDSHGWTPLIRACFYGKEEIVKALLARPDIRVDMRTTGTGLSAMDVLVNNHHRDMEDPDMSERLAIMLLDAGLDPFLVREPSKVREMNMCEERAWAAVLRRRSQIQRRLVVRWMSASRAIPRETRFIQKPRRSERLKRERE